MDKTLYTDAEITEEGTLKLNWNWLALNVRARWKVGQKVIVRVQSWTQRRSIAANNFYFGVIVKLLVEYTGHSKEEIHALLKEMFAKETLFIVNETTGEITETEVPRQTRSMSKQEFHQYIDRCIQFCTSLGIRLPFYEGDIYAFAEED